MNKIIEYAENIAEVQTSYKTKVKVKDRIKIVSSQDIYNAFKSLWNLDKIEHVEEFLLLLLNSKNEVLGWYKISAGGITGTLVDARIIFQIALKTNAVSIILAHNHPSGNTQPSQADINMTKKLIEAGKILEIKVLDHLIITEECYLSMADEGIM